MRLAPLILLLFLFSGCGPGRHFRVEGPASVNASGPGFSLNVVLEEGAFFDSHQHVVEEPEPEPEPAPME